MANNWAFYDADRKVVVRMVEQLPEGLAHLRPSALPDEGWYPVEETFPEDYTPRFPVLLGNPRVELEEDAEVVSVTYPNADFSPDGVRRALKDGVKMYAAFVLAPTDWYFIRKVETGEAVPEDVVVARQAVRDEVARIVAEIDATAEEDLLDFQWHLPTTQTRFPAVNDPGQGFLQQQERRGRS